MEQIVQGLADLAGDPASLKPFLVYVFFCALGQIGNAVWMWLGKEIECVADRFRDDPRSTIKSLLTNLGIILGIAVLMPWAGVPIKAALVMGLLQGLAADSKLNKSAREVWSPEQRQAKQEQEK